MLALFAGLGVAAGARAAVLPAGAEPPRDEQVNPPPHPDGPEDADDDIHDPVLDGMGFDGPPGHPPGPGGPGMKPPGMRGGPRPGGPGGPGGPPGGPGGPGGPMRPMFPTQEQQDALKAFAKDHFPELAKRLDELQRDDPAMARRFMRRMWPQLQMMKDAWDRDPTGLGPLVVQDHKLEMEIRHKAQAIRMEKDAAKKQAAVGELRSLLEQQFQVRVDRRKYELDDLEKRLAEQRSRLQKREAAKAEMIQRQLDRMTGEADTDW
ncbi:MAG: hypothetical protein U1A27_00865 [Phycisphaerae bacterium]